MLPNIEYEYDVFVSYSRQDLIDENGKPDPGSPVARVLSLLDSQGLTYWIDKEGIYSGQQFADVLISAIQRSRVFLFLSSRSSNQSEWTSREVFEASTEGKTIIPVRLDNSPYNRTIQLLLGPLDRTDFFAGGAEERLISSIQAALTQKKESRKIFYVSENERLRGLELLEPLAIAVRDRIPVTLTYRSYKSSSAEGQTFVFHPSFFKEYNNRWYIFGKRWADGEIAHFAIDRILSFEYAKDIPFISDDGFDPETWFSDVIGVTKKKKDKPETILFKVSPAITPYIESKPIHSSQVLKERLPDGGGLFEMKLIVNHELIKVLLGFADDLEVLRPDSLIETLKSRFQKALEHYSKDAQ